MKVRITPQGREIEVTGVRTVHGLLAHLGVLEGTVLVIRGEALLTTDSQLADDQTIEIRSVVSGG